MGVAICLLLLWLTELANALGAVDYKRPGLRPAFRGVVILVELQLGGRHVGLPSAAHRGSFVEVTIRKTFKYIRQEIEFRVFRSREHVNAKHDA